MKTVKAKFNCTMLAEQYGSQFVKLYPVVASNPDASEEDKAFWQATPNGSIELYINNPATEGFFGLNKRYYVTFEEVNG